MGNRFYSAHRAKLDRIESFFTEWTSFARLCYNGASLPIQQINLNVEMVAEGYVKNSSSRRNHEARLWNYVLMYPLTRFCEFMLIVTLQHKIKNAISDQSTGHLCARGIISFDERASPHLRRPLFARDRTFLSPNKRCATICLIFFFLPRTECSRLNDFSNRHLHRSVIPADVTHIFSSRSNERDERRKCHRIREPRESLAVRALRELF